MNLMNGKNLILMHRRPKNSSMSTLDGKETLAAKSLIKAKYSNSSVLICHNKHYLQSYLVSLTIFSNYPCSRISFYSLLYSDKKANFTQSTSLRTILKLRAQTAPNHPRLSNQAICWLKLIMNLVVTS